MHYHYKIRTQTSSKSQDYLLLIEQTQNLNNVLKTTWLCLSLWCITIKSCSGSRWVVHTLRFNPSPPPIKTAQKQESVKHVDFNDFQATAQLLKKNINPIPYPYPPHPPPPSKNPESAQKRDFGNVELLHAADVSDIKCTNGQVSEFFEVFCF